MKVLHRVYVRVWGRFNARKSMARGVPAMSLTYIAKLAHLQ